MKEIIEELIKLYPDIMFGINSPTDDTIYAYSKWDVKLPEEFKGIKIVLKKITKIRPL